MLTRSISVQKGIVAFKSLKSQQKGAAVSFDIFQSQGIGKSVLNTIGSNQTRTPSSGHTCKENKQATFGREPLQWWWP